MLRKYLEQVRRGSIFDMQVYDSIESLETEWHSDPSASRASIVGIESVYSELSSLSEYVVISSHLLVCLMFIVCWLLCFLNTWCQISKIYDMFTYFVASPSLKLTYFEVLAITYNKLLQELSFNLKMTSISLNLVDNSNDGHSTC